jgi:hypothetical protein
MKTFFKAVFVIIIMSTLTRAQLVPVPPVLQTPLNGAVNVSLTPNLNWSINIIVGVLSSFRLQVSTTQNFSNIILDSAGITVSNFTIKPGVLNSNTQYYWRVNASVQVLFTLVTTPYSTPFNFRTTQPTGIVQTNSALPENYELYNNYPNPFNPVTKIKFDNMSSSNVKIVVYDILGNEIEELVNEDLNAGEYEVEWNAAGRTSGVYFYRLTAGNFTDMKKMILVK